MYETETNFKDPSYEGSPLTNVRDNFASQTEVKLKATSHDLQRIGAVVEGLKRVYDNVATRAAEGMAMTPQEAADVNMAVTGMADSVDVDCQTLSVENFADPYGAHISTTISMEGIKDAILKGLKRVGEIMVKLLTHLLDWFTSKARAFKEKLRECRHVARDFGKIMTTYGDGLLGGGDHLKLDPEKLKFLLLDGGIPQNLGAAMGAFYGSCGAAAINTGDALERAEAIIGVLHDVLTKDSGDSDVSEEQLRSAIEAGISQKAVRRQYPELNKTRVVKDVNGVETRIGPALIGNHVVVFVKPGSNSPDDLIQDGSLVTTIERAESTFDIKTGYTTELKSKYSVANIATQLGSRGVMQILQYNFDTVMDAERKINRIKSGIADKLKVINNDISNRNDDTVTDVAMSYVRAVSTLLRLQQNNLTSTMTVLTDNVVRFKTILETYTSMLSNARKGYSL